jgi:5-methylthioribose kinase
VTEKGKRAYLLSVQQCLRSNGLIKADETVTKLTQISGALWHVTFRVATHKNAFLMIGVNVSIDNKPDLALAVATLGAAAGFYETAQSYKYLARFMPEMVAFNREYNFLILEDLEDAQTFSGIYKSHHISVEDIQQLCKWLSHLHRVSLTPPDRSDLESHMVEEWFTRFVFAWPEIPPVVKEKKMAVVFEEAWRDDHVSKAITALKTVFKKSAVTLVHGEYEPSHWISTDSGIYIQPSGHCSFGSSEYDIGMMMAHLRLAGVSPDRIMLIRELYENESVDFMLVNHFSGLEMMRRIISTHASAYTGTWPQKISKFREGLDLLLE